MFLFYNNSNINDILISHQEIIQSLTGLWRQRFDTVIENSRNTDFMSQRGRVMCVCMILGLDEGRHVVLQHTDTSTVRDTRRREQEGSGDFRASINPSFSFHLSTSGAPRTSRQSITGPTHRDRSPVLTFTLMASLSLVDLTWAVGGSWSVQRELTQTQEEKSQLPGRFKPSITASNFTHDV